jgi:L-amino acid N-acyltransferase YncA
MNVDDIVLRPAEPADAGAIAAIYAPIVRETAISFEVEPPSAETMAQRVQDIQQRYPWFVALRGKEVVGYAYAGEHRQRAAYRWSVDVTVYVATSARGKGVGSKLYTALIATLRAQGFRSAFAGITLPNAASVGLHESVGFTSLGVYKDVGFKLGQWHDVGWWRLGLGVSVGQPAEPIAFSDFRESSAFKVAPVQ